MNRISRAGLALLAVSSFAVLGGVAHATADTSSTPGTVTSTSASGGDGGGPDGSTGGQVVTTGPSVVDSGGTGGGGATGGVTTNPATVKAVPQAVVTSTSAAFTPVTEICLWQLTGSSAVSNPFAAPQTLVGCSTSTAFSLPTPACGVIETGQLDYYTITSAAMQADFNALLATKTLASAAQDAEFSPHDWSYPTVTGAACGPTLQACQTSTYSATVTPANFTADGWYTEDGQPTFESTSLRFDTPAASDKQNFFHGVSVPLAGIQGLSYHVDNATSNPTAAYDLEVDVNGTSGYTTLVYEPYQQNGGAVNEDGTFTNIENGKWWSTHSIPGDVGSSGSNQVLTTLAAIEAANPNAKIISYGVGQGSNNAGSVTSLYSLGFLCGQNTFTTFVSGGSPTPTPSDSTSASTPAPSTSATTSAAPAPTTSAATITTQPILLSSNPLANTGVAGGKLAQLVALMGVLLILGVGALRLASRRGGSKPKHVGR